MVDHEVASLIRDSFFGPQTRSILRRHRAAALRSHVVTSSVALTLAKQKVDSVSALVSAAISTMNPLATFQPDQPSPLSMRSFRRSDRQLEKVHHVDNTIWELGLTT